mmetsp:Transcript_67277/g.179208  ORF Transcript_67277/g.179208 Transcript_67277/m.179208 type:complete len:228 (+) Transcript_67277:462-1145(+)
MVGVTQLGEELHSFQRVDDRLCHPIGVLMQLLVLFGKPLGLLDGFGKQVFEREAARLLGQEEHGIFSIVRRVGLVALTDVLGTLLVALPVGHELLGAKALRCALLNVLLQVLLLHEFGREVVLAVVEDLDGHKFLQRPALGQPRVAEGPLAQVLLDDHGCLDEGVRPDLPRLHAAARVEAPQEALQHVAAVEDMADPELHLRGVAGSGRELRLLSRLHGRGIAAMEL